MTIPTYSTGTASVTAAGTIVTGVGTIWSGINVKQGDWIKIGAFAPVLVTQVTDTTHLKIPAWPNATQSGVAYIIYQNYVGRVVGVAAAEDVADMLERLKDQAPIYNVPTDETVPDPSYGSDGQWAYQVSTGIWWIKTGGVWTITAPPLSPSLVTVSDTSPGSPAEGQLWWEDDTDTLWIYNDGAWMEAGGAGGGGGGLGQAETIQFVIDGGGVALSTGVKGYIEVPYACTIDEATLLAAQSGSIVVDIYKCSYANFDAGATHPVVGDKITASAPLTISSGTKTKNSTLTGWSTSIASGDVLAFVVNSASTINRVTVSLKMAL